ncbi:MAG: DUF3556 domain-containing protein [Myxococcota bacterium]
MGFIQPVAPPYDPLKWLTLPLHERGRLACESWALQGYGTPVGVYGVYIAKVVAYVGGWVWFCSMSPALGGLGDIASWWLHPLAFQKAILWSMLFEGLGLGCGSGPLTGRYLPPVGGFLYFLRPGTTKLSAVPGAPLLGGTRRTWFDVVLYAMVVGLLVRALVATTLTTQLLLPIAALVPVLGLADKTLFLALRSEHYWVTIVVFVAAPQWIAGAKAVQLALWFWAGVSKLNHHFPTVVCVMVSNGPLTRFEWLRRRMYRSYPEDLRPSRLAVLLGHAGTALELTVPMVLLWSSGGTSLLVGMALMLMLHGYITSSVPMGVPIEWNVMVVYGAFALFWAHPEVSVFDLGSLPLAAFLVAMLIAIPILGNLVPRSVSFLMSMRYYAGNWAYSIWLLRGESYKKLEALTKSTPWIYDQLDRFYDHTTSVGLVSKVLAFRMMHLHGRALGMLLPQAVDDLSEYEVIDGEILAGVVLGWNFGDGHLHNEQLLAAVQEQCGFEAGEARCVFVESQPLGSSTMQYRMVDAVTGACGSGTLDVAELRARQPWQV